MKPISKIASFVYSRRKYALTRITCGVVVGYIGMLGADRAFAAGPIPATTLPGGGNVIAGSATLNANGSVLNINQSTDRAIVNWDTFSVGSGAAVSVTGVRKLEFKVAKLEPIEEPATVTHLIGFKCKCLVQTNISWNIPDKSSKDRREGAMAAMASLLDHFKKKDWKPSEVIEGRVAGELKEGVATNYIFFRGTNDRNSSVTLWGAPVTILKAKGAAKADELTADVDTINQIVVSYELDYKTPDIKRFNTTGF